MASGLRVLHRASPPPSPAALARRAAVRSHGLHKHRFSFEDARSSREWDYVCDNPNITGGYRLGMTYRELLGSVFQLHNETMNVWTHLLGAMFMLSLMLCMGWWLRHEYIHSRPPPLLHGGHHTAHMLRVQARVAGLFQSPGTLPQLDWQQRSTFEGIVLSELAEARHSLRSMLSRAESVSEEIAAAFTDLGSDMAHTASDLADDIKQTGRVLVADMNRMAALTPSEAVRRFEQKIERLRQRLPAFGSPQAADEALSEVSRVLRSVSDELLDGTASMRLRESLAASEQLTSKLAGRLALRELPYAHSSVQVPRWPIYVFLTTAFLCMLFSAIFHNFFSHSRGAYVVLSRLDYAGISLLIGGSCVCAFYYWFSAISTLFTLIYVTTVSVVSIAVFVATMMPRFDSRGFRAALFMLNASVGVVAGVHALMLYPSSHPHFDLFSAGLKTITIECCAYLCGVFFYVTRIPERIWPGVFDLHFHSHALWHVWVIMGASLHWRAALRLYELRAAMGM